MSGTQTETPWMEGYRAGLSDGAYLMIDGTRTRRPELYGAIRQRIAALKEHDQSQAKPGHHTPEDEEIAERVPTDEAEWES
jgi:hypothetical protein